jgi:hypothetical protein
MIKKLFSPKNILIVFTVLIFIHICYVWVVAPPDSQKHIVDFYWFFVIYPLSSMAIFIISIMNSRKFYKKEKRQFVYAIIPVISIGLYILTFVVSLIYAISATREI